MRLTFAHAVRRAAPVIFLSLILPVAALSQEAAEIATEVATEVAAETVVEEAGAQTEDAQTEEEGGFWSLLFNKGGVVTWIIAMLSAIGLPIAAVKFVQFLRMEIWRPKHVEAAMMRYRAGTRAVR